MRGPSTLSYSGSDKCYHLTLFWKYLRVKTIKIIFWGRENISIYIIFIIYYLYYILVNSKESTT